MTDSNEVWELRREVEALRRQVSVLDDVNAVRALQYKYGYYMDMCLYDEVVDLFAEDGAVQFLNGVYKGKAGVSRLYKETFRKRFTNGHNGPIYGFLLDHPQMQGVIDIAPDGKSAKARFRSVMQAGYHDSMPDRERMLPMPPACWEGGIYENEYAKEGGIWKIKLTNYNMLWQADYDEGWAHGSVHLTPMTKTYPEDPNGPDVLLGEPPKVWPHTRVVPFHYPHPVTGKVWTPSK